MVDIGILLTRSMGYYDVFFFIILVITSLVITLIFGGKLIDYLHKKQVGESIRDLGLEGQMEKTGTPTMGGVIIIAKMIIIINFNSKRPFI